MSNQSILCDVKACKNNNSKNCCCTLSSITVSPTTDCKTAHYCKDYEQK